jgi:hypothetical protein
VSCVLYVFYNQSHAVIHLALIWMIEKSVAREIDGWIYMRARSASDANALVSLTVFCKVIAACSIITEARTCNLPTALRYVGIVESATTKSMVCAHRTRMSFVQKNC